MLFKGPEKNGKELKKKKKKICIAFRESPIKVNNSECKAYA
jgi:glucose-6-phosphate 1-dehydrogenase